MSKLDMALVSLRLATKRDKSLAVAFDYALDKDQHIELKREGQITKAISEGECFIVLVSNDAAGFVIFDYRFFGQGWIELIIINDQYRGRGISKQVFDLICKQCKAEKVFTPTNSSNLRMQKALTKSGFTFAGKLNGLDDGGSELFYCKIT